MKIIKINQQNLADINKANQPFEIIGKIRPSFASGECVGQIVEWAKNSNLKGLALETQDNNLLACRFYAKCGFVIGAVNTMLYKNFDNDEFAVFWYLPF